MLRKIYGIVFGLTIFLHWGCMSYLYAPALNLSQKQLVKGEVDVKASIGAFPETQTQKPYTTPGGSIDLGYGFSKNFNLYANAWRNLSVNDQSRGGMTLSSRIRLYERGSNQLLLYPKATVLYKGNAFHTFGFELPVIFLWSFSDKWYGYAGAGYFYGANTGEKSLSGEELWGVIGHLGVGCNPVNSFRIMLELNPIYQYNHYYRDWNIVLSPTITAGYLINSPEKRGKFSGDKFKE